MQNWIRGLGGATGAATAAGVDFNNRQLHPTEAQLIRENAKAYAAKRGGITLDQALTELTEQALRQVDSAWTSRVQENSQAATFLSQISQGVDASQLGGGIAFNAQGTAAYANHTITFVKRSS